MCIHVVCIADVLHVSTFQKTVNTFEAPTVIGLRLRFPNNHNVVLGTLEET